MRHRVDRARVDIARVDRAQRHRQGLEEGVEGKAEIGAATGGRQVQQQGAGAFADGIQAAVAKALGGALVDLAVKVDNVLGHPEPP